VDSTAAERAGVNYIVLVKQVPDIKNIPAEAWDWEKGILKRGLLDTVCNELDKQALAFAAALRGYRDGTIVALTMGPPFASEVLEYAMAVCADRAVLLTDRKLGGADTPATAYPLAQAIRRIETELFGGDRGNLGEGGANLSRRSRGVLNQKKKKKKFITEGRGLPYGLVRRAGGSRGSGGGAASDTPGTAPILRRPRGLPCRRARGRAVWLRPFP
jgi:hypothetical protein